MRGSKFSISNDNCSIVVARQQMGSRFRGNDEREDAGMTSVRTRE